MSGAYKPINLAALNQSIIPDVTATRQLGATNFDWGRVYTIELFNSVSDGATAVGVKVDAPNLATAGAEIMRWLVNSVKKAAIDLAGNLLLPGAFVEFGEIADPTAPGADKGRLFLRDNGGAKTQLCIRFNTGAIQVIATQP